MFPEGMPLQEILCEMKDAGRAQVPVKWREHYDLAKQTVGSALRRLPTPVLVDCSRVVASEPSVSMALASCYLECLALGVRVAVSHCDTLSSFVRAVHSCGQSPPQMLQGAGTSLLCYDSAVSTVPLLETIRNQVQAGRQLRVVQASLSSSCGLILDRISRCGDTLLAAAECAQSSLGISDAELIADLRGEGVMEKLRVIAFALGCRLSDKDIELQPLLCLSDDPLPEALGAFDATHAFAERAASAFKAGRHWRYLATLRFPGRGGAAARGVATARVALEEVADGHFSVPLRGPEIAGALWGATGAEADANAVAKEAVPSDTTRISTAGCAEITIDNIGPIASGAAPLRDLAAPEPAEHSPPLLVLRGGAGLRGGGLLADVVRLVGM